VRKAIERILNPSVIDQIFPKLYYFPSTGVFGLYDLIGHDVMALISK
jgi:3-hydroxyacyl-CoA dehydrogenase/enoyl-CoA hydratase/3-hydroxybutyryl-CoA epimerase